MRVLAYNSSARGAGQFVRSLKLAKIIANSFTDARTIILAGNSVALHQLPERTEVLPLQQIKKAIDGTMATCTPGAEEWSARPEDVAEAFALRQITIRSAIETFAPDVFLVDSRPAGLAAELLQVLPKSAGGGTRRNVLILRDIVDDPGLVRKRWAKDGTYDLIADAYDDVLVFGDAEQFDAVAQYQLAAVREKVKFLGYLGSVPQAAHAATQDETARSHRVVLVTVGGGSDGERIIERVCAFAEEVADTRDYRFHIVLGQNAEVSPSSLIEQHLRISAEAEPPFRLKLNTHFAGS